MDRVSFLAKFHLTWRVNTTGYIVKSRRKVSRIVSRFRIGTLRSQSEVAEN